MLKSMNFLSGKSMGRVGGGGGLSPLAPVILGLVPRILFQQGSNLINKLALLLHKCWLSAFSASTFSVILRRYSLLEVPWRRIHNVIAKAMSICVAYGNKVIDTHLPQLAGRGDKYDVSGWCWERLLRTFCKFFKYPSPDAKASPSPSRGEGYRLFRSARNDGTSNGEGLHRPWCHKILGTDCASRPRMTGGRSANSFGRSMIEMLGVLAIIGVLSVGGIAGYSKAMMKYKINKMTEEYTMLMTGLMEYQESLFKTYADAEERNLSQFIIDAKLVPETWKLVNQQFISDSLGNTISAYVDVAKTGVRFSSDIWIVSGGENKDSEYAYQLCMALAHDVVYPLSANADFALLFINNKAMPNYGAYTVYSKSCRNSDFSEVKCMADMTLSEISAICKSCVQQSTCNVGIGWR